MESAEVSIESQEPLQKLSTVSIKAAEAMGDSSLAAKVESVINLSREKGIIFHGIKDYDTIDKIQQEGITRLSPEGRGGSFWTKGSKIFGEHLSKSMFGYDSTFFHWAHASRGNIPEGHSYMAIAATTLSSVEEINGHKPDKNSGELQIPHEIPRNRMWLLKVDAQHNDSVKNKRKIGAAKERAMLDIMEEAMKSDTELGATIEKKITVD